MSENHESLQETAYLLRFPKNARRLLESIDKLKEGKGQEQEINDDLGSLHRPRRPLEIAAPLGRDSTDHRMARRLAALALDDRRLPHGAKVF